MTAAEHMTVAEFLGLTTKLFALDAFWTREATDLSADVATNRHRVPPLRAVLDEMDRVLVQFEALAPDLAACFDAHATSMRAAYPSTSGQLLTPDQIGRITAYVERHGDGDIATSAIAAAGRAARRTDAERQALVTEYSKLEDGAGSDGDLTEAQWIDVGLVSAGVSVLFGPEAGAVVLGAAGLFELLAEVFG